MVRIKKNYMGLWNYETMGVIELQSYRTIEDIIKELWRVRSIGVRNIGVQELLKNYLQRGREN